jgi:hypothetical protein
MTADPIPDSVRLAAMNNRNRGTNHIHDPELDRDTVERWFAVGGMQRALSLHHRHTGTARGRTDNPVLGEALGFAGLAAGGSQWPGGVGGAERAYRDRSLRLAVAADYLRHNPYEDPGRTDR